MPELLPLQCDLVSSSGLGVIPCLIAFLVTFQWWSNLVLVNLTMTSLGQARSSDLVLVNLTMTQII